MATKKKLEIGQKLWANPEGPNSGRMGNKSPIEVEVLTIGKKYITVKDVGNLRSFNRTRFFIENLQEDGGGYSAEWQLYTSLQELEDKKEASKLSSDLARKFQYGIRGLSLDQLRRITAIIEEFNQ